VKLRNLFIGLAAATFSAIAMAQAPIVIKFSHVVAADTPKGKASEFFAKKAAELTKGKAKVEVYANSALYKDKEEMEALQLGAVQMLAPSLAKFGPLGVKEFEAFDFPYIFDDTADLHKITQGPVGASLLAKLEPKGIKGLAFWDNGFKSFSANTPIKAPADLKGKKIAHPVVEGARRADPLGWRPAAGDGLLRGLSGLADRRCRWHGEPHLQPLLRRRCMKCRSI
jgi:C4-dicarboxylate-binding protein DctP